MSNSIGEKRVPLIERRPWSGGTLAGLCRDLELPGPIAFWESASGSSAAFPMHQPGRYRYAAFGMTDGFSVHQGQLRTWGSLLSTQAYPPGTNVLKPAEEALALFSNTGGHSEPLPPFLGGLIGCLSYDAAYSFENIQGSAFHPQEPELYFHLVRSLLVHDTIDDLLYYINWPNLGTSIPSPLARLEQNVHVLSKEQPCENPFEQEHQIRFEKKEFIERVKRAKEYIAAGDIFQVVLANQVQLAHSVDPLSLYESLRELNPSPYHFLLPLEDRVLVGASPEAMFCAWRNPKLDTHEIAMRLVAGTYPRTNAETNESAIRTRLLKDKKERAEHIMLVDHVRNDIGRSAEIGSVEVSELLAVEPYSDVYHLVSQVNGVLRKDNSVLKALQAAFPIATLTGTPKIRAMEIIAELEGPARGLFGGTALMLGPDGFLDASVIIRSALVEQEQITVSAGAGIVHDSVPEREFEECLWKAKALLSAVAAVQTKRAA